jgi:hypothetical protein
LKEFFENESEMNFLKLDTSNEESRKGVKEIFTIWRDQYYMILAEKSKIDVKIMKNLWDECVNASENGYLCWNVPLLIGKK